MQKARTYDEINKHPTKGLCPPLEETALIHALVSQYLSHECFVGTARAFSEDVRKENQALELPDSQAATVSLDTNHESDAINRQRRFNITKR